MAFTARSFLLRLALAAVIVLLVTMTARAGGPREVAGSTYFAPSVMGQPLTWAQGSVSYYTDQGALSPILPNSAANAFVANAFASWTAISTAAVASDSPGELAEDVNGSNVILNSDGTITMPADIQPSATNRPVGIVYDYDGSVTSAFLGSGSGDPSQCFWNAAFGGTDNFSTQANILHALVVINGQCAVQSSQLTDVTYRLVRVLGGVLGLGWSQANLNVITGNPPPTSDDFAGFPVMHYADNPACIPITLCYPNPYLPAPDDAAALSRLYPVTAQNVSNFPGKQIFSANTARIHGSVYFVSASGTAAQPMQGVNVVARWIDPTTNLPSRQYVVTSVSGFLFTGNAGNPVTGPNNPQGVPYSEFGSNDTTLEGFFDLAGLPIPAPPSNAQFQLSVEPVDPTWSAEVGPYGISPYAPNQVVPSGAFAPIIVTVGLGGDIQQDILMSGSAQALQPWTAPGTWTAPVPVPPGGDWMASLSGYGQVGYFSLTAQANRTLSITTTAFDETGAASESKAAPVIGMWAFGDAQGTAPAASTSSPFNSLVNFGTTRLDAQVLTSTTFLIGIADLRGDGRPDYGYHARVLYADSAVPARLGTQGGIVALQGYGFAPSLNVTLGSSTLPIIAVNANRMLVAVPMLGDGAQTITLTDPASGAFSTMTGALIVGAAATDKLVLLQGGNPPTPVGTQATNPMIVQVLASDGVTPVYGATIGWTTSNGATLSACGGTSTCSMPTDESGIASTWITPGATGSATITATLAPGVYNPPQSVSGTVVATSSSLDIGVTTPYLWIAQNATVSAPLTARVVSNGVPQSGVTVNFAILQGSGTLSAASATSDSNGYAGVTLSLTNFTGRVLVSACVAPGNAPCQTITGNAVAPTALQLQIVAGAYQIVQGQPFQPMIVRVTDSSTPPNPVLGAGVTFQSMVLRPIGEDPIILPSDPINTNPGMPVILSASQSAATSDANGLASIVPSVGAFSGTLEVAMIISAGATAVVQCQMESFPQAPGGVSPGGDPPPVGAPPHPRAPPAVSQTDVGRFDLRAHEGYANDPP